MLLRGILSSFIFVVASALSTTTTSEEPQPTPSTIVDILSSDVQYSYFLRALQINELIPTLNGLENVTILAPVNLAFAGMSEESINRVTDSWLRYIINQKVRIGYLGKKDVMFQTLQVEGKSNYTVKFSPDLEALEYVVDDVAVVLETDIYAKHQHSFVQAIDHLLPNKQDICSMLLDQSTNMLKNHSISFVKSVFRLLFCEFNNSRTLCFPNSYDHDKIIKQCSMIFKDKLTIFIPTDEYVNGSLPSLSQRYYSALIHHQHDFAITKEAFEEIKYDVQTFFEGIIVNEYIGGENGTNNRTYKPLNKNSHFNVNLDNDGSIIVNNIKSAEKASNIVLSNGVIHLFDYQESKNFFTQLEVPLVDIGIPRKALFALHFSHYVRDLEYNSLGKNIASSGNKSFIIPLSLRDDIQDEQSVVSLGYKQNLKYQFSDEFIDIRGFDILKRNVLVNSGLCSKKRIGSCFKIKLSAIRDKGKIRIRINDDATLVWDPIILPDNTAIYVTDKEISSPGSFRKETINLISKSLDFAGIDRGACLKTLEYIGAFDLFNLLENGKGYTAFLPCAKSSTRDPWSQLGLILTHLQSNPNKFKQVFNGLFVEGLIYSDTIIEDVFSSVNLNQIPVIIKTLDYKDGDVFKINGTEINLPSYNSDYLFNQGVIQVIDEVILPDDFEISLLDLIKTTINLKTPISILDLIEKVPDLSNKLGLETGGTSLYSLLSPKQENLQNLELSNLKQFSEFMSLHLIPNSQIDILLSCLEDADNNSTHIIETNHPKSVLKCHKSTSSKYEAILNFVSKDKLSQDLSLSNGEDHIVRITSHGCTRSTLSSNQSCVFLIDKPINVRWLDDTNFLHIHIGFISIGVGLIFGFFAFGALLYSLMFYQRKQDKETGQFRKIPDAAPQQGPNSTFMRVTNNEDLYVYDRGYETDIDVQNERDSLLPLHFKHGPSYGAIDTPNKLRGPHVNESRPKGVGAKNIPRVLNRYNNLPPT